ncbi:hypothetical protein [Chitinilyticum aquatile]|uniref:hypothetical protein n=1 Tax=Chitinilyticum aquatile TaxID=362520 RepID=UPI0012DCA9AD|nr:hypothetical protein [Chitinilyticum aquatile]
MPIPLLLIAQALAAGGTIVPHAAGGMIVTSSSGYVAGTYLSTSAISTLLGLGGTALGAGATLISGAASAIIGGPGIFGTTIGASGITGMLMSAGIISSTPVWVPVLAIGGGITSLGAGVFLYRLRKKAASTPKGEEAHFSELEAKFIEKLVQFLAKNKPGDATL